MKQPRSRHFSPVRRRSGLLALTSLLVAALVTVVAQPAEAAASAAPSLASRAASAAGGSAAAGLGNAHISVGGRQLAAAPGQPAALASAAALPEGDVVITLDAGSGFDKARTKKLADEMQGAHARLSDTLKQDIEAHPLNVPHNGTQEWVDFNGTLSVTDTGVTLTVPRSEVQTAASWWWPMVAGALGALSGLMSRSLCIGLQPEAIVACSAIGGFIGGLVRGLVLQAANDQLKDLKAWANTLVTAIEFAVGAAAWEAWVHDWSMTTLPGILQKIGEGLRKVADTLGGWFSSLKNGLRTVGGWISDLAGAVADAARNLTGVAPSGGLQIAMASYIHPKGDPTAWNELIGASSTKVSVLVANVLNGPGSEPVKEWTDVINRAHASGKKVLGYVDTGYFGQADNRRTRLGSLDAADWVAQIDQDVNAWYELYPGSIDGIFFDDGFNACGSANQFPAYYHEVNDYTKRQHPGALTVLNPGIIVPNCYDGTADILLTYEGNYDGYFSHNSNPELNYKELGWTPKSSKIWHIVYQATAGQIAEVAKAAVSRGVDYVEITDDVMPNPYDQQPDAAYWKAEQDAVSGGVPVAAPPTPYSGISFPGTPVGLAVATSDYTSATLTWNAASGADRYLVYRDGTLAASLPPSMTRATLGGLAPGGKSYQFTVRAESPSGNRSGTAGAVSVTTMSLPGGKPVGNVKVSTSATSTTYSADFFMPYSFHRVFVGGFDLRTGPADSKNCWSVNYNEWDAFCTYAVVENSTFLSYAGSGGVNSALADWTWKPIAYTPPTLNGYTYTWTIPAGTSTYDTERFVIQGEGYGPGVSIFSPCPRWTGGPNQAMGRYCA